MSVANALGEPGKGIHFHVCGIAVMDVAFTALAAFIVLMVVGTIVHYMLGVRTTITKAVFPE